MKVLKTDRYKWSLNYPGNYLLLCNRVTSVFEFKGPELIECRLFVIHKSHKGLYFVDITLGEFGLQPQN